MCAHARRQWLRLLLNPGQKALIGTSPKTSQTHPLQIARLDLARGGRIGVTFAPGKHDAGSMSGPWARDLGADLDAIVAWPAQTLVTLIEPHEFDLLSIPKLGEGARRRGLKWLHLPIRDVSTPSPAFEATWPGHSARLRDCLASGQSVVIHCRGGLGRAGMIAARLLVESGVGAEAAIERVRAVRPGAIETWAQEAWVRKGALIQATTQAKRGES
jgi:protein-tyrosine phosphatase